MDLCVSLTWTSMRLQVMPPSTPVKTWTSSQQPMHKFCRIWVFNRLCRVQKSTKYWRLRQALTVCIEGGTFSMGRDDGPDTQGPRHSVRIPTFWISQSEITVAQFRKCVRDDELSCTPPSASGESSNYDAESDRESHPINGLNIEAIDQYLRYVGDGARLPQREGVRSVESG